MADIVGSIGPGAPAFLNQVNESADAARAPDRTERSTEEQLPIKLMIMAG